MAKSERTMLDKGDQFPSISLQTVEHGLLDIHDNFAKEYGVVLINRRH